MVRGKPGSPRPQPDHVTAQNRRRFWWIRLLWLRAAVNSGWAAQAGTWMGVGSMRV